MTRPKEPADSLFHSLRSSIESLLVGSSGQLQSTNSDSSEKAALKITSIHPNRAPIELILDDDFGAYIKVGKGSIFEVPLEGKRYTTFAFGEEIAALINGIIASGFEEDVLVSKGTVVGASGTIKRGGTLAKNASESWRKIGWNLFSRKEREHHSYQPY